MTQEVRINLDISLELPATMSPRTIETLIIASTRRFIMQAHYRKVHVLKYAEENALYNWPFRSVPWITIEP